MASIQRIMVVDTKHQLGSTVRTVMSLMDRRYILLEIPTTEAALAEISLSNLDLLITGYKADGTMTGIEFAQRAIREQAGLPILIVGDEDDPTLDALETALTEFPFQYINYPYEDQLLRGIRVGLDGADVVAAEEGTSASGLDLGPIPPLDINSVRSAMISIIRELSSGGCMGGFISDRIGRIVVDEGATGYVDKTMIAAMFGPDFANAVKISPQIGGNAWLMKYFDGEKYDLFALSLGLHYFMAFIFDGSKRGSFGLVTRYGREGADKIIQILGDGAWAYQLTEAKPKHEKATTPAKEAPTRAAAASTPAPVVEKKKEPTPPKSKVEELQLEPVKDFDLDKLLAIDSVGDDSLDFFGEDMGISLPKDEDGLSFEDARNMGLLG